MDDTLRNCTDLEYYKHTPPKRSAIQSPDEELRRRETPKLFRSDRKMTPAQLEARASYWTRT